MPHSPITCCTPSPAGLGWVWADLGLTVQANRTCQRSFAYIPSGAPNSEDLRSCELENRKELWLPMHMHCSAAVPSRRQAAPRHEYLRHL